MHLQEPMPPSKSFTFNCVRVGNPKLHPTLYTAVFPLLAGGKKKEEKKKRKRPYFVAFSVL